MLLAPLEEVVGGRASADKIIWTENLETSFKEAKNALKDIKTVFIPKPTDTLHTFSDYSASTGAIGGRMEIRRTDENGTMQQLQGGDFSCRVSKYQRKWYPCEGEALATKMVLEHFAHYLGENKNTVIHHTDNLPVVHAWKRSKAGSYSSSARIATFLSGLSALNVEIVHTPGKDMKSSDFNSRHPVECHTTRCQICLFANQLEDIGERSIPMVGSISVTDIHQG